ncbi:MAG: alpha/beta hydrolase [Bryobacterales bacterium]|nr:alpha/beta hydrolase [Bryobacterales bacterium]
MKLAGLLLALAAVCGGQTHTGLTYAKVGDRELKLDLYLPSGNGPHPLLVWVHGGAWRAGDRAQTPARFLTQHGYAVASISYRLSQVAQYPAQIDDCKAAVKWLRDHGSEYKLNTRRIAAWGSSAGGHLVALLGVMSQVDAVIDFFGPTDFLRMNDVKGAMDHDAPHSPESQLVGGPIQQNQDKVAKASPLTYVNKGDPPFLIVHGDADPLVHFTQSQFLDKALRAAGVPVELVILPGAGHGGPAFNAPEIRQKVVQFLDRNIRDAR